MGLNQAQWEKHSAGPWALEEGHAFHSTDGPLWKGALGVLLGLRRQNAGSWPPSSHVIKNVLGTRGLRNPVSHALDRPSSPS